MHGAFEAELVGQVKHGAVFADTDGVDFHAHGGGGGGGFVPLDLAGVFLAVCHENDDAAFGILDLAQAIDRRADAGADGGAFLRHGIGGETIEVLEQKRVIERGRAGDVGLAGKGNEPDAIAGPALDEFLEHILAYIQTVGVPTKALKILGKHAVAEVHGHHNINTAGADALFAFAPLRPGQSEDEDD